MMLIISIGKQQIRDSIMSASIIRKEKKLEVKQTRCGRWMMSIPFGMTALFVENPETRKRYHSGTFLDKSDAEMVRDAAIHEAKVMAERMGKPVARVVYRIATNGMWAVDREPEEALLYA
jgi:hypothetical protein